VIRIAIFAVCVFVSSCAGTRSDVASAPDPDDVAVRAAVDTLYAVVSGEKGVARPWERLKELFVTEGYFCISGVGRDGKPRSRTFSVDAFVEGASRNAAEESFYERPMVTRVEVFGGVASVWSSYASSRTRNGEPFARGVNAFTLIKTAQGWRFCVVAWSEESPGLRLPAALRDH